MSNPQRKYGAVALVLAVVFAYGLVRLFLLRFEAGDVYPAYSSLRADPLGTQALHDSLEKMNPNGVRRNFLPPKQLRPAPDQTILILGVPVFDQMMIEDDSWKALLDRTAASGGRVVIAFRSGVRREEGSADQFPEEEPEVDCGQERGQNPNDTSDEAPLPEDLQGDRQPASDGDAPKAGADWKGFETLGISVEALRPFPKQPEAIAAPEAPTDLPAAVPWYGTVFFEVHDETWKTVYTCGGRAVILHRPWGRGSLVVAADSFLFSNEALRHARHADLLAWFVGPCAIVVFDEIHLGLSKQPGIAGLIRKYRLQGLLGVVLLIAVLVLWQQTAVFAPPLSGHPQDRGEDQNHTTQGLANLMRQHIPRHELLENCYEIWRRSPAAAKLPRERLAVVQDLIKAKAGGRHPQAVVGLYRDICHSLKQGKFL